MKQALSNIYHALAKGKLSKAEALAQIKALKQQQIVGATTSADKGIGMIESLLANPVWVSKPITATPQSGVERKLLLSGLNSANTERTDTERTDAELTDAEQYQQFALECFNQIKTALSSKDKTPLHVQIVAAHPMMIGLSALLKTASLENPLLSGQVILTDEATSQLSEQLLEQEAVTFDQIVRYQAGERQVLQWQALDSEQQQASAHIAFKENGSYLITGGLGGLGVIFANEVLQQTSKGQVIVTGRKAPNEVKDKLAQFADETRVSYRQLDLTDGEQVAALVADIVVQHGKLEGIFHSAGMVKDNFILKKSATEFADVLAPKVLGSHHLDVATQHLDLDFLVLFSSVASWMGNVGQADYACANGFIDQFAHQRNQQVAKGERVGHTLALNWPYWADGGMSIDEDSLNRLQQATGIHPLNRDTGVEAFYRALQLQQVQTLVMRGDLAKLKKLLAAEQVFARKTAPVKPPVVKAPTVATTVSDLGQDFDLNKSTRQYLRAQFADVLKMQVEQIDVTAPLEDYGIDSILSMSLTTQLEKTFGSLSKTLFFEYLTIAELSDYFVENFAEVLQPLLQPQTEQAPAKAVAAQSVAAKPAVASAKKSWSSKSWQKASAQSAINASNDTANVSLDPIAIIGLSGRYPESWDIDAFWQNLRSGKDCIVEVPASRWDWQQYYSEDRTEPNRHYSKWGGFIEGFDEFDPRFFNISPKEALTIDPQERLFLQHCWMAIEDAGYERASLQQAHGDNLPAQVGVYAGVMYGEYNVSGSLASIANRVSYVLNLHGPCMTLDTMCSSSITAIHLACQDLKLGRTNLGIAGGVNVSIHPSKYLMLSGGQFISSDGHCQSFGEGGDGYIPGEGVGVVVLKRLSQAVQDHDNIYAVIKGAALNHGGKTNGYSVPNPQAQADVIKMALFEGKVDPRHISYIEAHGTGTKLGDPIEVTALSKAFYHNLDDKAFQYCALGSAKSNIGHCESAAAIAGLTKVLLQMKHGKIVPSLHSARLNPHIDFANTPFAVNQQLVDWQRPQIDGQTIARIAGISSFGAGGANGHLLVEEYQGQTHTNSKEQTVQSHLIVLSARTEEQLKQQAEQLAAFMSHPMCPPLVDIAYTLQVGRDAMEYRLAAVVSDKVALKQKLAAFIAGEDSVYVGNGKKQLAQVSDITTEQSANWLANSDLTAIATHWVKGLKFDWSQLYAGDKPYRVSLPTYPFARQKYWTPPISIKGLEAEIADETVEVVRAQSVRLHSLVHENVSNVMELGYRSQFAADEDILPSTGSWLGVYIEMARFALLQQAADKNAKLTIEQLNWVEPSDKCQLSIAVFDRTANAIDFEIYSGEVVYCQGHGFIDDTQQSSQSLQLSGQSQRLFDGANLRPDIVVNPQAVAAVLSGISANISSANISSGCVARLTINCAAIATDVQQQGNDFSFVSQQGEVVYQLLGVEIRGESQAQAQAQMQAQAQAVQTPSNTQQAPQLQPEVLASVDNLPAPEIISQLTPRVAISINQQVTLNHSVTLSSEFKPASLSKPDDIKLINPQTLNLTASALAKPSIVLAKPGQLLQSAPAQNSKFDDSCALYSRSGGVYELAITQHDINADWLQAVSQALATVATHADVKVLMLSIEQGLSGDRAAVNLAIEQQLLATFAQFDYPIVANVHGEVSGCGLLILSLCDFVIAVDSAQLGYGSLFPTQQEDSLLRTRFGNMQADTLLTNPQAYRALELKQRGWTINIVKADSLAVENDKLVISLAQKSAKALKLLKTHLARDIVSAAMKLEVLISQPQVNTDAQSFVAKPVKVAKGLVASDIDNQVLTLSIKDKAQGDWLTLFSELSQQINQADDVKAVVVKGNGAEFLPGLTADDMTALYAVLADFSVPLIAQTNCDLSAIGWLCILSCDVQLYAEQLTLSSDQLAVTPLADALFRRRFGDALGIELLLSGQSYTSAQLHARYPSLLVEQNAKDITERFIHADSDSLKAFKLGQKQLITQALAANDWPQHSRFDTAESSNDSTSSVKVDIGSDVIHLTAYDNGVVLVEMDDKQARNMFSQAYVDGMQAAFEHIAQSPNYKVVVLTGYDSYFASGGTKESLVTIGEGKGNFTDNRTFQIAHHCRLPVVAAMQGHGIGAGWALGMYADVVLMSKQSRFLSPYMNYGFTPGAGSTFIVVHRGDRDLARETLMTAVEISGAELAERGWRIPMLARKEVLPTALSLANQIAVHPREQLLALKQQWLTAIAEPLEQTIQAELALHQQTFVGDSQTMAQIQARFSAGQNTEDDTSAVSAEVSTPAQATVQTVAQPSITDIQANLRTMLAQELHMDEDEIETDAQFIDIGLDSITGVTWVRKINEHYATDIDATKVYSYPTLAKLSDLVLQQMTPETPVTESMPAAVAQPVAAPVVVKATPIEPAIASTDIVAIIQTMLAQELHMETDEIEADAQFIDIGLDSITGVTWVRKINEHYGTNIDATKVYSYPTLNQLAALISDQLGADISVNEATAQPVTQQAPVNTQAVKVVQTSRIDQSEVIATIATLLAQELHMDVSEIAADAQFIDIGLDSITGVTWVRKINEVYHTNIDATKVYSYSTLNALSGLIVDEAAPVETVTETVVETVPAVQATPVQAEQAIAVNNNSSIKLTSWRGQTTNVVSTRPVLANSQIAVIGMAGQFPMAKDVDEFWHNIANNSNCITTVGAERWDLAEYYRPGKAQEGKCNSQWFGAMPDFDLFDPLFFNISPTEALAMEPQQRLFLQSCWHGIENAGYNPQQLAGSKCGVFVGCASSDYHQLSSAHQLSAQAFTGGATSILAARIAYFLDLTGPNMAIETACSSSLVAISSACDSLTNGSSDMALAGGVYVMSGPQMHVMCSQTGMLSTDGRCFTFDQRANGFVPGEAVGVVLLKRLEDAEAAKDNILGLIDGWGINQDGKTNGITAPNAESQTRLEVEVYNKFNIDPANISLIENHGTGTKLGDPIEIEGLTNAFNRFDTVIADNYCALGSVKSNIGHCLTAAGIAGFIKLMMAFKHQQLPPSINYQNLNEHINLNNSPFYVNDSLKPWQLDSGKKRQAAISSFGFSGTNAHIVVSEYQAQTAQPQITAMMQNGRYMLPLSAKTPEQLKQAASNLLSFVLSDFSSEGQNHSVDLLALIYTLQVGREAMEERLGLMVANIAELTELLQAYVAADKPQDLAVSYSQRVYQGQVRSNKASLSVISQDEDVKQAVVSKWLGQSQLTKLIGLWVKGLNFDWNLLYGEHKPQRIALPGYPFARTRYWFESEKPTQQLDVLHPLVHQNTSVLAEQRFSTKFTGNEAWLVDGCMPACGYLEMIRAAISLAVPHQGGMSLHQISFAEAIVIDNAQVDVILAALSEQQIECKVQAGDTLLCQAQVSLHPQSAAQYIDIQGFTRLELTHADSAFGLALDLLSQLEITPATIAQLDWFAGNIAEGSSSATVYVQQNGNDIIVADSNGQLSARFSGIEAQVQAPAQGLAAADGPSWDGVSYVCRWQPKAIKAVDDVAHKTVMIVNCASSFGLQQTIADFYQQAYQQQSLPQQEINIIQVQLAAKTEQLSENNWLVGYNDLDGFATALSTYTGADNGFTAIDALYFIAMDEQVEFDWASSELQCEVQLLRLSKLLKAQQVDGKRIDSYILTADNYLLDHMPNGSRNQLLGAGSSGLAYTLAQGNYQFAVRNIDLSLADLQTPASRIEVLSQITKEPASNRGEVFKYHQGKRYEQHFVKLNWALEQQAELPSVMCHGGVYLILGGSGIVGQVFTRLLIQRYQAKVVWLGRSSGDKAKIKAALAEFDRQSVSYIQTDVTDSAKMQQTVERVLQQYGGINGAIFSGMVSGVEHGISETTEADLQLSIGVKVQGSKVFYEALKHLPLDFMCYFSSGQAYAFSGASKLAGYSTGISMADSYVRSIEKDAPFLVGNINWGFWAQAVRERIDQLNSSSVHIDALEDVEGFDCFERFMSQLQQGQLSQVLCMRASRAVEKLMGCDDSPNVRPNVRLSLVKSQAAVVELSGQIDIPQHKIERLQADPTKTQLEQWFIQLLFVQVNLLIKASGEARATTVPALTAQCRIIEKYQPWWLQSLQMLAEHGFIGLADDKILEWKTQNTDKVLNEWQLAKPNFAQNPEFSVLTTLTDECLTELGAVLQGEVLSTDIIFPNSSMDKVAGLYRNNSTADTFNEVVANTVACYVEQQLANNGELQQPLRILEIGAGTGGTSAIVFERMKQHKALIEKYCYTDLSKAFFFHAEQHFVPDNPYVVCQRLDIEQPIAQQGIELGSYDLVLSTNALHATKDMRNTIAHAKTALKKDGLIIINEMSYCSLATHLTFGLLDGWWLFTDPEVRIPGCPGLYPDSWQQVLEGEGFNQVLFPVAHAHDLGNQVIVAKSDGVIAHPVLAETFGSQPTARLTTKSTTQLTNKPLKQQAPQVVQPVAVSAPSVKATQATPVDIPTQVNRILLELLSDTLKISKNSIQTDMAFSDYGIDSILGVKFVDSINESLGIELNTAVIFEYASLERLSRHLLQAFAEELNDKLGAASLDDSVDDSVTPAVAPVVSPVVAAAPQQSADEYVHKTLLTALSSTLQISANSIDVDMAFSDYGIDSILGVKFVDAVNETLAIELNTAVIFEYASIKRLQAHIIDQFGDKLMIAQSSQAAVVPTSPAAVPAAPVAITSRQVANHAVAASETTHVVNKLVAKPNEKIAIIGMAGQFPKATDVATFWDNLMAGVDGVDELPPHYLDIPRYYDSQKQKGKTRCKWGGILTERDCFDPLFFSLSPKEAESMNPHQRMVMQESWKALEDAGYSPKSLAGSMTGIFVGAEPTGYIGNSFTGLSDAIIASRLSYVLDFNGPAFVVNTGCSASALAIHLACESLKSHESSLALAGGVNACMDQHIQLRLDEIDMLSPSGRCFTFDVAGDGTIISEGAAMVVLKRLSDAVADKDSIYGVIAGSGVNQDGASNGITAPSGAAQEQLICDVYHKYDINPEDISYVEAHGTGTKLGDPIETNALVRAFGKFTDKKGFCAVGSAKSHIGHAAAAAGAIGLIKVLMSMQHQQLPALLNYHNKNPLIEFDDSPFYINTEHSRWQAQNDKPRMAAINSFGHSGTNVHLVVQEHLSREVLVEDSNVSGPLLIVLSAKFDDQLMQKAKDLQQFILANPSVDMAAVAYTLQLGREAMVERLAMVVNSTAELNTKLDDFINGRHSSDVFSANSQNHFDELDALEHGIADRWAALGQWHELLAHWVKGLAFDWQIIHAQKLPRLHLPVYPFAKERYWIDQRPNQILPGQLAQTNQVSKPTPTATAPHVVSSESIEDLLNRIDNDSLDADAGVKLLKDLV